ncbi:MAG: endonuclease/exonuclease/phosphatase family protein [Actinobacteria bacterium]|nr:endonuclease/exonuclease/phosphatase family protein [Actinomycetota bacterium]
MARQDGQSMCVMRLLTWNLFHGRARPAAGRPLLVEFAEAIAGWKWDVALLQEVPPWWPRPLAERCDAEQRTALTSRNALPAVRRFIARRAPDVIKSNGGGANVILVRRGGAAGRISEHRSVLLRRWPERRVCHAVALGDGPWCANLHAQVRSPERAAADIARAAAATLGWARGAPALLAGDFNVRAPAAAGFERLGGHGVDHVLGHRLRAAGAVVLPDRGTLSDHAALIVEVLPQEDRGYG